MGRIWEYISLRARRALSIKEIMSATMLAVGGFHAGLLVFFSCFRIYPMVIINIMSISLYIYCYKKIQEGKDLLRVFNLTYIEIVLHAVIAVLLLGVDSGFSLYLIAMLPLGYYAAYNFNSRKRRINPMFYVSIAGVAFCFVRIASNYIEPLYSYGNKQVDRTIYMINYFVAVIAIVLFFSTLLNQIRILEKVRKHQNKRLEKLAKIDPLTGLVNRRSLEERYSQAELLQEEYAVIIGDVDNFKKVNDTYGHDIGDEVLKAIAEVFKTTVREEDMVCRWGGEEILVFLPRCSREDGRNIANRILEKVRETEVKVEGTLPIRVTMTLGVSISTEAEDFAGVTKMADERLYYGKHSGKNCVV